MSLYVYQTPPPKGVQHSLVVSVAESNSSSLNREYGKFAPIFFNETIRVIKLCLKLPISVVFGAPIYLRDGHGNIVVDGNGNPKVVGVFSQLVSVVAIKAHTSISNASTSNASTLIKVGDKIVSIFGVPTYLLDGNGVPIVDGNGNPIIVGGFGIVWTTLTNLVNKGAASNIREAISIFSTIPKVYRANVVTGSLVSKKTSIIRSIKLSFTTTIAAVKKVAKTAQIINIQRWATVRNLRVAVRTSLAEAINLATKTSHLIHSAITQSQVTKLGPLVSHKIINASTSYSVKLLRAVSYLISAASSESAKIARAILVTKSVSGIPSAVSATKALRKSLASSISEVVSTRLQFPFKLASTTSQRVKSSEAISFYVPLFSRLIVVARKTPPKAFSIPYREVISLVKLISTAKNIASTATAFSSASYSRIANIIQTSIVAVSTTFNFTIYQLAVNVLQTQIIGLLKFVIQRATKGVKLRKLTRGIILWARRSD